MVAGCIEATRHEGPWPAGEHGGVGLRPRGKPATRSGWLSKELTFQGEACLRLRRTANV